MKPAASRSTAVITTVIQGMVTASAAPARSRFCGVSAVFFRSFFSIREIRLPIPQTGCQSPCGSPTIKSIRKPIQAAAAYSIQSCVNLMLLYIPFFFYLIRTAMPHCIR